MKLKISLSIAVAAILVIGMSGAAFAFHGGGVAACESCHTMHNSKDGAVMSRNSNTYLPAPPTLAIGEAGPYLLQGTDQSSTCLNCHGSTSTAVSTKDGSYGYKVFYYGVGTAPYRSPGGDFAWLKKGAKKGHNVVAADYALAPDSGTDTVAPGGTYPKGSLHCSSCHDPHGKYRKLSTTGAFATTGEAIVGSGSYGVDPTNGEAVGAYRLLAGKNYTPDSLAGTGNEFTQDPMNAAVANPYNLPATDTIVNYGKGVGAWCQQCHPKMHMSIGTAVNVHPNDQIMDGLAANYNNYVSSGKMVAGGGGFDALIPVSYDNKTKNSELANHFAKGTQITTNDQVMCLSCHRAHASGFDYMLRFPIVEEMVVDDGAGNAVYEPIEAYHGGPIVLTAAEVQAALYDRPASDWGIGQRTLCNKCHAKD